MLLASAIYRGARVTKCIARVSQISAITALGLLPMCKHQLRVWLFLFIPSFAHVLFGLSICHYVWSNSAEVYWVKTKSLASHLSQQGYSIAVCTFTCVNFNYILVHAAANKPAQRRIKGALPPIRSQGIIHIIEVLFSILWLCVFSYCFENLMKISLLYWLKQHY